MARYAREDRESVDFLCRRAYGIDMSRSETPKWRKCAICSWENPRKTMVRRCRMCKGQMRVNRDKIEP